MRVGQLIQSVNVEAGGTSTAFLGTLDALRSVPGVEVRAISTEPPAGDPCRAGIEARRGEWRLAGGQGSGLRAGALGRLAAEEVRSGGLDVLHIHGLWSPDLLAAARACAAAGVAYVWEPHGMLVREAYAQKRLKKELFMAAGMRAALRGAAALAFVTAEERDHSLVPSGIGPERLHVVPLPVADPPWEGTPERRAAARARFAIPGGAPCVVFMGRLHHVKRVDMALRAAAVLSKSRPETRVLVVGGGEEKDAAALKALAASLGLEERAVFAGWLRGEDKWLALAAGDVLTLNSVHENFGYVAVEGLRVGTTPVLTSNLALALDLGPRGAGLAEIAEPDEASLAAAYERALAPARQRTSLERGPAWVAEHLSARAVGARLMAVYASVVPSAAGRGA